jgi:hypothetical protein
VAAGAERRLVDLVAEAEAIVGLEGSALRLVLLRARQGRPEDEAVNRALAAALRGVGEAV